MLQVGSGESYVDLVLQDVGRIAERQPDIAGRWKVCFQALELQSKSMRRGNTDAAQAYLGIVSMVVTETFFIGQLSTIKQVAEIIEKDVATLRAHIEENPDAFDDENRRILESVILSCNVQLKMLDDTLLPVRLLFGA
jgi:hypothetical protein